MTSLSTPQDTAPAVSPMHRLPCDVHVGPFVLRTGSKLNTLVLKARYWHRHWKEAEAALKELDVEIERLKEALAPFAAFGHSIPADEPDSMDFGLYDESGHAVNAGDFRRAAALSGETQP